MTTIHDIPINTIDLPQGCIDFKRVQFVGPYKKNEATITCPLTEAQIKVNNMNYYVSLVSGVEVIINEDQFPRDKFIRMWNEFIIWDRSK